MSEIFRNVLNAGIQGSIVIGMVLLLRLALKKAPKKYICLLWILAGVRLLMPFSFESKLSLQPAEPIVTQQVWEDLRDFGEVFPADAPTEMPQPYAPEQEQPVVDKVPDPEITVTVKTEITPVMAAPWIWLTGIAVLSIYSLISWLRLRRRVREAVYLFDDVWECAGLDTAFILGLFRPRIYIPAGLSDSSGPYILEHERCHLQRHDHWVKLIGFAALTIHWFNPLVWLGYILLCRDMEMACDEAVVEYMNLEERKRYSAALLECSANRIHWAACPVAFGEVSVKQRILGVLNYRRKSFWFSIIGVIAIIFVAVCFLTDPAQQKVPAGDNGWENEIRAVLEEIQSRDYYHILEDRQFEGEYILNDSAQRNAFRSGDTWLRIDYIEDAYSFSGYMGIQGRYYDAVSDTDRFEWREVDMTEDAIFDPWLYSFDIDAQEVTANAMWTDDNGYYIRLVVHAPYEGWIYSEDYYVDFGFDSDGNFKHAIQYVKTSEMINGKLEEHNMTVTMYAPDIPEVDIQRTIAQYAATLPDDYGIHLGTAMLEAPDWNIRVTLADITPAGLTFKFHQTGELLGQQLFYGKDFFLERWNGSGWEAVEPIIDDWGFTLEAITLEEDAVTEVPVNWKWLYGELPEGTYRIGKDVNNRVEYMVGASGIMSPPGAEETSYTYYASFEIEESVPTDPAAALSRCEEALKVFQELESYVLLTQWDVKEPNEEFGTMTTQLFSKAGENWQSERLTNTEGDYHLKKDGVLYQRTVENVPESAGDSGWHEIEAEDESAYMPWLSTFRWNQGKIEYVQSIWPGRDAVSFTVHDSPLNMPHNDRAEQYSVTFCFIQGTNNLETVYLNYAAEPADGEGSFEIAVSMTPQTGMDAAEQIERVYTQEIAQD